MINVLNISKVSQINEFGEFKFEFEFDSASTLPIKAYPLGTKTCLIANGSLAKNISNNTYWEYNKGRWSKILGKDIPTIIKNTSFTDNGNYSITNDNYKGYNDININVSAPTSTIIEKSITTNGVYNALDDSADGYNPINVNVANTYTAEDEGKVVNNETLIAQTAYPTEITENDTYDTTNYNSITVNVSGSGGGGFSGSDVIFYDYDGTVVASYSAADFANLSAMPDNPTHTGLTAQGWNWSLADAKAYVATYGKLNIGQMYITSDGKTRLYFTVTKDSLQINLSLLLEEDTELDIDWGDNSEHTTWTSNNANSSKSHTYSDGGRYCIAITVVSGGFEFTDSANTYIQDVEMGSGITKINSTAFSQCYNMMSITIPNTVTSIESSAFYDCHALLSITIPDSVTSIGSDVFFGCYALSSITIPNSVTNSPGFKDCQALSSITIPDTVAHIGYAAFQGCYALKSIIIPSSVLDFDGYPFDDNNPIQQLIFTSSEPPTMYDDYAFGLPYTCVIRVPQGSLEAYTTAESYPDPSTYIYEEY